MEGRDDRGEGALGRAPDQLASVWRRRHPGAARDVLVIPDALQEGGETVAEPSLDVDREAGLVAGAAGGDHAALRPITSSTCSRYSSRYFCGWNSAVNDSTSTVAIRTSRSDTLTAVRSASTTITDAGTSSTA